MRANRKTLKAENAKLKAQLASTNHATRKALNEYVKVTRAENENLKKKLKEAVDKVAELTKPKEPVAA